MNIVFDGDRDKPEIYISGTVNEYHKLAEDLIKNHFDKVYISGEKKIRKAYLQTLDQLIISLSSDSTNRLLKISLEESAVIIIGDVIALTNLGNSINNFFNEDSDSKDHLHLDYFPGNQIVAMTNCDLILGIEEK